jgi:NDP-sugar pyrophosphorylase family protein
MQAVILAAGKGSRLGPITKTRSKAMLPIVGKPIVERIIENLVAAGLQEFILVASPEDDALREYFQRHAIPDINFVHQTRKLGTADALKQAAPNLKGDFILSACDTLVSVEDVQRLISIWHQQSKIQALLCLQKIFLKDTRKTAIVTLNGDRVTGIIEKPAPNQAPTNISSLPLYCFSTRILNYLPQIPLSPRGEYELPDAIQLMIDAGEDVRGLYLQNRLTLTTAEDLLKLNLHFLNNQAEEIQVDPHKIGPDTILVQPFRIDQGVEIGSGCKIGPGVYLEKGARISDGVQLKNVVVLSGAVIPEGAELINQVVTS